MVTETMLQYDMLILKMLKFQKKNNKINRYRLDNSVDSRSLFIERTLEMQQRCNVNIVKKKC